MEAFYVEYLDRLRTLHDAMQESFSGLPSHALDWSPGRDMNSMAVIVVHTAGSERFWIGQIAGGVPAARDRESEFRTTGHSERDLGQRLDAALVLAESVTAGLTTAALLERRGWPERDTEFTMVWALLHALEHTATHVGHIQIMRQLWELRGDTE